MKRPDALFFFAGFIAVAVSLFMYLAGGSYYDQINTILIATALFAIAYIVKP